MQTASQSNLRNLRRSSLIKWECYSAYTNFATSSMPAMLRVSRRTTSRYMTLPKAFDQNFRAFRIKHFARYKKLRIWRDSDFPFHSRRISLGQHLRSIRRRQTCGSFRCGTYILKTKRNATFSLLKSPVSYCFWSCCQHQPLKTARR